MQMLLIVSRNSLQDDVLALLKDLGVRAFTDLPKVFGVGEAGTRFGSFEWPGFNSLILVALEDEQARRVVDRLTAFRDRAAEVQRGAKIPLRVFVVPCTQAL